MGGGRANVKDACKRPGSIWCRQTLTSTPPPAGIAETEMGQCVHHFSGKEQGSRKLVSWRPDFVTSAAHGAMIISLGFCGTVNLHKALLRQRLGILPALENQHAPDKSPWLVASTAGVLG